MNPQTIRTGAKYLLYILILIILYTFQTTPGLFGIAGIRPVLLVPLCISIAMFETELPAALFGIAAGMLWDLSSNRVFGFYTIILLCCCVTVSLMVTYLIRTKLFNAVLFSAVTLLLAQAFSFVFHYFIWGYDSGFVIVTQRYLPTLLYTSVWSVPVFLLIKRIEVRLSHARN